MLLEHGANACVENSKCQTLLHVGVLRYGSVEVVRMLLEHGANTCAEDIEHQILGPVAWSRASVSGHVPCIACLACCMYPSVFRMYCKLNVS